MKLVVAYIIYNENNLFFKASLKSVEPIADHILIIDGGSTDGTLEYLDSLKNDKIKIIHRKYQHELRESNGMQRNEYLKWAARMAGYDDTWVLVVDADEVLSDNCFLLKEPSVLGVGNVFTIQMVHFIRDFGHVDSTRAGGPAEDPTYIHRVDRRFFKLTPQVYYPEVEHPVLLGYEGPDRVIDFVIFYHLGYLKGIENLIKKSINHKKKSNMHKPEFLEWWTKAHLYGFYPVREIKPDDIKSSLIREWLI